MPAVGLAFFMTGAPFFIKTVAGLFLLVMSLITSFLIWRIMFSNTGGDQ
jgi:membrane protein implicated in regulation of membrane protease activity